MSGLQLFMRANSPRLWNVAAYHSPHSLTWSWILSISLGVPTLKPHVRRCGWVGFHAGIGTLMHVRAYRTNNGWQWGLALLGASLSWSRQQPMWYRDLYLRLRDRQDQMDGMLWLPDSHPNKIHNRNGRIGSDALCAGGLIGRCECAAIRREAFAEAALIAAWEVKHGDPYRVPWRMRMLARKPESL